MNVCSGNMWFFDWVFAGMILSFLKLRQGTLLVHGISLELFFLNSFEQIHVRKVY